ncbi:MAG: hypothetical protein ACTHNL_01415 [Devosia sp.]
MSMLRSAPAWAATFGLLELALTSVHHVYGAYAYDTPWRTQIALYAVIAAALIVVLSAGAHRRRGTAGTAMLWANMILVLIVPVLAIGLVEGGYNHALKNLIYFAGAADQYRQMFPAPPYEVPADWFFEATGVLQFPVGIAAGIAAVMALVRGRHAS